MLKYIVVCFVILGNAAEFCAGSVEQETLNRNYVFYENGQRVGQQTVIIRNDGVIVETLGKVNLSRKKETSCIVFRSQISRKKGILQGFDHWIADRYERWHLKGVLHPDEGYWVSAAKVKSKEEQDVDDLFSLGGLVVSQTVPYAGVAGQVLELFSSEESEGEEMVPSDYYDSLDLDIPLFLWNRNLLSPKEKVKVFLTDDLRRKSFWLDFVGHSTVEIDSEVYECKIFELTRRKEKRRYWVTSCEQCNPFVVREEIEENGFAYTMVLSGAEIGSKVK